MTQPADVFSVFMSSVASRYGSAVFQSWMADLSLDECGDDVVVLSTPSAFKADRLNQQYRPVLHAIWSERVFPVRRFTIVPRRLSENAARAEAKLEPSLRDKHPASVREPDARDNKGREARRQASLEEFAAPLDPRNTFESFATDASNALAFAAVQHLLNDGGPGELVYIYGAQGVGKTHLLHALGHEWRRRFPDASCAYFPHSNIRNGFVSAVLSNSIHGLHRDMLAHDLVLLDDLHLLINSTRTIEEIMNLVSAFTANGRRLVIAGELAPARLAEQGLNRRLADRLSGGLCAPMSAPGEGLRLEALRRRRDRDPLPFAVEDSALEFIARHFPVTMRDALGAYAQLKIAFPGRSAPVGAADVEQALKARLQDNRAKPDLEALLAESAAAFNLTIADLKGRAQPQRIVRARHAYTLVARDTLGESFPRIAALLGRDHTTAISSYRRAGALITRDKTFQALVASIRAAIGL